MEARGNGWDIGEVQAKKGETKILPVKLVKNVLAMRQAKFFLRTRCVRHWYK